MKIRFCLVLLFLLVLSCLLYAGESLINQKDAPCQVVFNAESGFLGIIKHTIQFGLTGTEIDYIQDANQNVLFPFSRFSADLLLGRSTLVFLYQPLTVETSAVLDKDIIVDGQTFASNTPMHFTYGFPFYRVSWIYSFLKKKHLTMSAGLSLQIRNARILFESADGAFLRRTSNIGPVPVIKFRTRFDPDGPLWFLFEADGFYASSSFFNGADFEFTGAVYDIFLQTGVELKNRIEPFIGIRLLGGGAEGTSEYPQEYYSDGYTRNWLSILTLNLGVRLR